MGATTSNPGSSAWTATSKRTWSLPLPVHPCATASAPSACATSTRSWASSGRARAVARGDGPWECGGERVRALVDRARLQGTPDVLADERLLRVDDVGLRCPGAHRAALD